MGASSGAEFLPEIFHRSWVRPSQLRMALGYVFLVSFRKNEGLTYSTGCFGVMMPMVIKMVVLMTGMVLLLLVVGVVPQWLPWLKRNRNQYCNYFGKQDFYAILPHEHLHPSHRKACDVFELPRFAAAFQSLSFPLG